MILFLLSSCLDYPVRQRDLVSQEDYETEEHHTAGIGKIARRHATQHLQVRVLAIAGPITGLTTDRRARTQLVLSAKGAQVGGWRCKEQSR